MPCRRCLSSGRSCSYRTRGSVPSTPQAQTSDMGMAFSTTCTGSGLSQAPDNSEINSDLSHRQGSVADINISQPSFLSALDGDISGTVPTQPSSTSIIPTVFGFPRLTVLQMSSNHRFRSVHSTICQLNLSRAIWDGTLGMKIVIS